MKRYDIIGHDAEEIEDAEGSYVHYEDVEQLQQQQIDALKAQVNDLREVIGFYLRGNPNLGRMSDFMWSHKIHEAMADIMRRTKEQSLEEHDKEIYNKAIEDALLEFNKLLEVDGIDRIYEWGEAIRQLSKQTGSEGGSDGN